MIVEVLRESTLSRHTKIRNCAVKDKLSSEPALIIWALIGVNGCNYLFGFEVTVLSTLALITAHVFKMSRGK